MTYLISPLPLGERIKVRGHFETFHLRNGIINHPSPSFGRRGVIIGLPLFYTYTKFFSNNGESP
jgi:hypothetical protein